MLSGGDKSQWLPITRVIVQGSGIGPLAYLVYSMDLKTLSQYNSIIKFADDTTILVPQYSSISMKEEFQHVQRWSATNKLQINVSRTKEIIFRRQCTRRFTVVYHNPCRLLQQTKQTKVALIIFSAKLPGEGFIASHLPLMTSYLPETKNISPNNSNSNHCLHSLPQKKTHKSTKFS